MQHPSCNPWSRLPLSQCLPETGKPSKWRGIQNMLFLLQTLSLSICKDPLLWRQFWTRQVFGLIWHSCRVPPCYVLSCWPKLRSRVGSHHCSQEAGFWVCQKFQRCQFCTLNQVIKINLQTELVGHLSPVHHRGNFGGILWCWEPEMRRRSHSLFKLLTRALSAFHNKNFFANHLYTGGFSY